MTIDPRLLRHAVALAKHGSFSKAARMLGLTQPALSKSIRGLEETVGCELFDREARDLCPTAAGRALLIEAEQLLASLDDLPYELGAASETPGGRVVLGVGQFANGDEVCGAVARVLARHPRTEIEIVHGVWWTFEALLRAREIDAFIGEHPPLDHDESLRVTPLSSDPSTWFVRSGHPLAGVAETTSADVMRFPLAMPALSTAMAAWLVRKRAQTKAPQSLLVCKNVDLLQRLVATTDAIGAASPRAIEARMATGELTPIGALNQHAPIEVSVVTLRDRPLSRSARELVAEIEATAQPGLSAAARAPVTARAARQPRTVESDSSIPYDRFLTPRLDWSPVLRNATRRIDAQAYDYVSALARERSFSRAARTLGLTQSGLSKAIGALEAKVGARLFTRSSTGAEPTEAGEELMRRLEPLMARLESLPARLAELARHETGRIVIGLGSVGVSEMVVRALGRLLTTHAGVAVQVVLGHWLEVEPALRAGEIDLWVGFPTVAMRDPSFDVTVLEDETSVAFVRPGHPLADAKRVTPDQLRAHPVLVPHVFPAITLPVELGGAKGAVVCNNFAMLRQLARHGDCVALMPRSQGTRECGAGELRELAIDGEIERSVAGIVTLSGRTLPPAAAALAAELERAAAEDARGEA